MRILFFGNNWVGWQVLRWLKEQEEEIVGLVVHPAQRQKYGTEMKKIAGLPSECTFDGGVLHQDEELRRIMLLKPDIGISALFGYILHPELLDILPEGCVNIHPGLLPYNRGAYPNVWSIVDQTPAGVSIHYVDSGIDTGAIIAQLRVPVEPVDTGESLYHKLEHACLDLFKRTWPHIRAREALSVPQLKQEGTNHKTSDVNAIDAINLDRTYVARELIDIIRGRTFPPYPGAYFYHKGRKIYLRLKLLYEEELSKASDG